MQAHFGSPTKAPASWEERRFRAGMFGSVGVIEAEGRRPHVPSYRALREDKARATVLQLPGEDWGVDALSLRSVAFVSRRRFFSASVSVTGDVRLQPARPPELWRSTKRHVHARGWPKEATFESFLNPVEGPVSE